MARDFDGTNDEITYGSDASIDGFTVKSISVWISDDLTAGPGTILAKDRSTANWEVFVGGASAGVRYVALTQDFTTTDGTWSTPAGSLVVAANTHVAVVYDRGATTNDPTIYLNGVAQGLTESSTPVGTSNTDATATLWQGETGGGTSDFNGRMGWLSYHNVAFTAEDVNRARWWGRPFGGLVVYHPLVTSKLANEGTGVADGTATGSTMVAFAAPVVRPGAAMMGMGIGW